MITPYDDVPDKVAAFRASAAKTVVFVLVDGQLKGAIDVQGTGSHVASRD